MKTKRLKAENLKKTLQIITVFVLSALIHSTSFAAASAAAYSTVTMSANLP